MFRLPLLSLKRGIVTSEVFLCTCLVVMVAQTVGDALIKECIAVGSLALSIHDTCV